MGWPKGVPMRRQLSDSDLGTIAGTDASVTTVVLAVELGKPYFTVAHARQKIARMGGWYCLVSAGRCSECGEPVLTSPDRRQSAHLACRPARAARYSRIARREGRATKSTSYVAAWREREPERSRELREQEKARLRARWPDLPAEERQALLARVHAADARDYPLTVGVAEQSGSPWTDEEDQYVLEHPKMPAREVALVLGRTLWAVRGRRMRLRRQPVSSASAVLVSKR
jgi:hypothetical protein